MTGKNLHSNKHFCGNPLRSYTVHNASVCTNKMYRMCALYTCTFFGVPVRGQQIPRGLTPEMTTKKLGLYNQIVTHTP